MMRTVLYKLAHRLVTSSPTPSYISPDRFYLHLCIIRELGLLDEGRTLLESDVGRGICSTSLVCDELRRDIFRLGKLWMEEGEQATRKIVDNKYAPKCSLSDYSVDKVAAGIVIGWSSLLF